MENVQQTERHEKLYAEFSDGFRAAWFFAFGADASERKIRMFWHDIVLPILDRNPDYQTLSERDLSLFIAACVSACLAVIQGHDPSAAIAPYAEQALREEQAHG